MAVILPWHDPVRVAEQISVLDNLSHGRLILAIGRGLGKSEFEGLRIPMEQSRERFLEAAHLVLEALETGILKHDGPIFQQPERQLRPSPYASFRSRTYAAAMSLGVVRDPRRTGRRHAAVRQQVVGRRRLRPRALPRRLPGAQRRPRSAGADRQHLRRLRRGRRGRRGPRRSLHEQLLRGTAQALRLHARRVHRHQGIRALRPDLDELRRARHRPGDRGVHRRADLGDARSNASRRSSRCASTSAPTP